MRLTDRQLTIIKTLFLKHFSSEDHIWLFGSRVDNNKRGGDIDLYIETANNNIDDLIKKKILFIVDLKKSLGNQKIDVIMHYLSSATLLPIYTEAKETGVKLL